MNLKFILQPQKFRSTVATVNDKVNAVLNKIKNTELPERFKGTVVEKLANYWKGLYLDYKDVAVDVVNDCRTRPIRASVYATILASSVYICKHNPDERTFRETLLQSAIKMMQVGQPIRNPISENHVRTIERCYNEGIIRRLNLGLFSVMWVDNYDELCALYKAVCPYLKPRYFTFYERIIDVGFLDKWWILEQKMADYDVNETEFINVAD